MFAATRSLLKMKQMSKMNSMLLNQSRFFAVSKKFTKTHEWIEFDSDTNIATLGITDHAQAELGDIVHVDLPEVGTEFTKNEVLVCIESVKTAADIYQMVDGEVVEINESLADDSSVINSDAEGQGWVMKVKLSDPSQMDELLGEDQYKDIL